jgi:hypothetical protein
MFQLARTAALAASLLTVAAAGASAQRGPRGTMGLPRIVPAPSTAPAPAPSPGRAIGGRPQFPSAGGRRPGDLPRIVGDPLRRRSGFATGFDGGLRFGSGRFGSGRFVDHGTRFFRPPYARWGVGAGCGFGCIRGGARSGRFFGSFLMGYPFAVPYYYGPPVYSEPMVDRYGETDVDAYAPEAEPAHSASKLIVIGGGTGGGGDALTVETIADSVRLTWLGAGRAAREVTLFVADSTQRRLATRNASPSAPTATFEVATLSSPVAYAGVSVTFTDGVTTTTLVPYQKGTEADRRR